MAHIVTERWADARAERNERSGAEFEVGKFNGTGNFRLWQRRVMDLLAQQGLLQSLRKAKPATVEELDWTKMKERTTGTVRLCLANEVMYHVMDLTWPLKVWKKLEGQYMSKTLTNKLYLKQRLYGLKIQEGLDLQQHVNTFNQIISDLLRLDVKIDNEDKTIIMLCSLPSFV